MQLALSRYVTSAGLFLVTAIVGCGGYDYGPTGTVTGRLTMDGKPLPAGHNVSFMDMEKGYLAFGTTDADGNFTVQSWNEGNMPAGKYKVTIAPPAGTAPAEEGNYSAEEIFDNPELLEAPAPNMVFPRKYGSTTTSGLEYQVEEGENHFDIDIKSKPDRT